MLQAGRGPGARGRAHPLALREAGVGPHHAAGAAAGGGQVTPAGGYGGDCAGNREGAAQPPRAAGNGGAHGAVEVRTAAPSAETFRSFHLPRGASTQWIYLPPGLGFLGRRAAAACRRNLIKPPPCSWYADNKTKVKMAGSSLEEITKAIELDPGEDMAYYCVGRWHNEMAGVNALVRALVPVLYGAALPSASYETARAALERAVELRPDRLVHRLELGRTHHLMGAHREAEAVLEAAMELEVDEINSHLCKLEMQQTLKKLQKRGRGRKPTA
mmetsp:Transcript_62833/g.199000  ORF Transcript_62833/g.199000 Transcript_62833/m.199000 type:complete len:273 (-) Transcript_62833:668-1486(-)